MVMLKPAATSSKDIKVKIKKVELPALLTRMNSIKNTINTINDNTCSTIVPVPVLVDLMISIYKVNTPSKIIIPSQFKANSPPEGKGRLKRVAPISVPIKAIML